MELIAEKSEKKYKKYVTKHVMEIMGTLKSITSSPSKLAIILLLAQYNHISKTTIYNMLKKAGVNISYKNTSTNLDQLEEDGFLTYRKVKKDHNAVYVSLNKDFAKVKIREIVLNLKYVAEVLI